MDVERIFDNPDWHLFALDGDRAIFLDMDRDAYRRSIFLDKRISPRSARQLAVPIADLDSAMKRAPLAPPPAYIFHIAHCGSTLLARALDIDANLVLREPPLLRQAGAQFAGTGASAGWQRGAKLVVALTSRRYAADAPVIVKANVPVNFILRPLMEMAPQTPALLLHFSLENYLLAILRSENGRAWVTRITNELQGALTPLIGPPTPNDDAVVQGARLWLAQMLIYADALKRFPNVASLDAEVFFAEPQATLAAAFIHFGTPQTDAAIDDIVGSDLFSTYSKQPGVAFDNAHRLSVQSAARAELGSALEQARNWVLAQPSAQTLPAQLAKPLLGGGRALFAPTTG